METDGPILSVRCRLYPVHTGTVRPVLGPGLGLHFATRDGLGATLSTTLWSGLVISFDFVLALDTSGRAQINSLFC